MQYAYILERATEGTMARFDYDPPIEQLLIAKITHGIATSEEISSIPPEQSMVFREPFGIGRVPVAFGYLSRFMHVSSKIKNYIEALEPGVHQFLPISLQAPFPMHGLSEQEPYYILMPPPVVDCIIVEETRFARGFGLEGWQQGLGGTGGGGLDGCGPCVLRRRSVAGRHLWRIKVGKQHYAMASEEFWHGICQEPQSWGVYLKCTVTAKHDNHLN